MARRPNIARDRARAGRSPIDGVDAARCVVEPAIAARPAPRCSRGPSRERLPTVIRGGGTKLGWGRPPDAVDLRRRARAARPLLAHRARRPHGDRRGRRAARATSTRRWRAHGQWLPLDTRVRRARRSAACVATNDSGPLRHRYGTPRDLLIGITLALTDGRLVKAGGTVVKNVAGYDLGKLVSGSFGSLAGHRRRDVQAAAAAACVGDAARRRTTIRRALAARCRGARGRASSSRWPSTCARPPTRRDGPRWTLLRPLRVEPGGGRRADRRGARARCAARRPALRDGDGGRAPGREQVARAVGRRRARSMRVQLAAGAARPRCSRSSTRSARRRASVDAGRPRRRSAPALLRLDGRRRGRRGGGRARSRARRRRSATSSCCARQPRAEAAGRRVGTPAPSAVGAARSSARSIRRAS